VLSSPEPGSLAARVDKLESQLSVLATSLGIDLEELSTEESKHD